MLAHVSGKHRGGESVLETDVIKPDETENGITQLTPSGRIKRKAASRANKKVVEAFKDIDASVEGEDSIMDADIEGVGDGDDLNDDEYNVADEIDSQNIRKLYHDNKALRQTDKENTRFSCLRCKFKSHDRSKIEKHIIHKHSNETIEVLNEEEEKYESDDEFVEDNMEVDEDEEYEDLIDYRKSTPSKKSKKISSKSYQGKEVASKAPPLFHDRDMIKNELKFRESNFCADGTLFERFQTTIEDWIRLNATEKEKHLPTTIEKSISFKVAKLGNDCTPKSESNVRQLDCFDSCIDSDNLSSTFYAGGPIWAADWCSLNETTENKNDVMALSVDMDFQTETKLTPENMQNSETLPKSPKSNSLLQLWSCNLPSMFKKTHSESLLKPKMTIGIVHNYGKIWCVKWCPSGCEDLDQSNTVLSNKNYLSRLGLLATACSDGSIRIFSIPKLSNLVDKGEDCVLYKARASSILTLCHSGIVLKEGSSNPACLSLSWYKGKGHRVLGGAYADGNIALWDIQTKSILLKSQCNTTAGTIIYPYMFFRAHLTGVKISLDFGTESLGDALEMQCISPNATNEDCFYPRYLVSGSSDRVFAVWDLSDGVTAGSMGSIVPIRQFRRHLIRYSKLEYRVKIAKLLMI